MVKRKRRAEPFRISASKGCQLLLLCGFFVLGSVSGHIFAQVVGYDHQLQTIFSDLSSTPGSFSPSLWSVLFHYFRFPLLALLIGYCSFALLAIPLLMFAQGFVLSFAASALQVSLGINAISLTLVSFGLRSIIIIICTLILAMWSFKKALGFCAEKVRTITFICVCFLLLVIGVIIELTLMPKLFSLALAELNL